MCLEFRTATANAALPARLSKAIARAFTRHCPLKLRKGSHNLHHHGAAVVSMTSVRLLSSGDHLWKMLGVIFARSERHILIDFDHSSALTGALWRISS